MHRVALALAAVAPLVVAHGPGGDKPPVVATQAENAPLGVLATDPAGAKCKVIAGDAKWPADDVWQKSLPGVKARGTAQTTPAQPNYRLEVSTVKQVQDAVNFARENNIRVAMITSGHDGLGRNNAQTGLLLGLENLRGLRVESSFTPSAQGVASVLSNAPVAAGSSGMAGMAGMNMKRAAPVAVTFGAGMSTQSVNDKIAGQNIFTNGAEHGEVSVAGGWAQCGGHGPMTSAYGLGADDVLEYQIVTPDGQLKIANSVANPDLFWALRGGCGSTYGVVVQTTVKAFPSNKVTVASWTINAKDANGIYDPTAWLHSKFVDLSKKGVQGYYLVFPTFLKGIFHSVGTLANQEFANQTWTPILEKLKSFPGIDPSSAKVDYINYNSYKAYYDGTWGPAEDDDSGRKVKRNTWWWGGEHGLERRSGAAASVEMPMLGKKEAGGSRLLDEAALKHPDLAAALKAGMPSGPGAMLRGGMIGGGYVLKIKGDETSVHPSWRKAYASLWVGGDHAPLAKVATGMGAYINEGSYNESNWKEVFWGSNYQRLSDIKTKVDPNFVFYATPGINADQMVVDSAGRLCQIAAASVNSNNIYPPVGDNWLNNPGM